MEKILRCTPGHHITILKKPSAFPTVNKLSEALPKKNKSDVKAWLEHQEIYSMYRPVRKRSLRNPYTFSNIMYLWEFDILDRQSLAKFNDIYSFILFVIDVFSKYLHLMPVKTKSGRQSLPRFDPYFT